MFVSNRFSNFFICRFWKGLGEGKNIAKISCKYFYSSITKSEILIAKKGKRSQNNGKVLEGLRVLVVLSYIAVTA